MSGHSKWSTIKRQKHANDAARGQTFTKLANAITIAVKDSGGSADPQTNFRLRLAIDKARQANMPKTNIDRAIDRGAGKGGSGNLEEVLYEGFAPHNVVVLVEAVTDNRQRTIAAVRNVLAQSGGALGRTGSVAYLFKKCGVVHLTKQNLDLDKLLATAIECGAQDLEEDAQSFTVYCQATRLHELKECLIAKNYQVLDAEITYRPGSWITISDAAAGQKIIELLTQLEDLADVSKVHTNADFKTTV